MSWVRVPPEQLFLIFLWKKRCSGLLYCLALIYVGLTVSMYINTVYYSGGERSDAVVRLKLLWTIDSCHYYTKHFNWGEP